MWLLWVVVAVVGIVPPVMLMLYRPKVAAGTSGLHYSRAAKIFLGVLGLLNTAMTLAVSLGLLLGAKPLDWGTIAMLPAMPLVMAGGGWMLGDVWFVRHQFSEQGLHYRSPWSRHRGVRWEDVVEVRWRAAAQWIDLHDVHGDVFHLSTMLAGIGAFSAMALQRLPEAARERSAAAMRILESVRGGQTAALTGMNRL
jgi:Bacterial PH domain